MGNAVEAVGSTIGGTGLYVSGTVVNDHELISRGSNSLQYAGQKYKAIGKQISETAVDTAKAVTNISQGVAYSAYGGVTNNKEIIKKGINTFEDAGNNFVDAIIGKACISSTVDTNICKPYNITINRVNTEYEVLQGIIGLALIEPMLLLIRKNLQKKTNQIIKHKIETLVFEIGNKLKNIKFHKNKTINHMLQSLWKPQNINATFIGDDKLCLSLTPNTINSLGLSLLFMMIPAQTIRTTFKIKNISYKVSIFMDIKNGVLSCTIHEINTFIDSMNGDLCANLIQSVGNGCYNCTTNIHVYKTRLSVNVKVFIKVPL